MLPVFLIVLGLAAGVFAGINIHHGLGSFRVLPALVFGGVMMSMGLHDLFGVEYRNKHHPYSDSSRLIDAVTFAAIMLTYVISGVVRTAIRPPEDRV